MTSLQEKILERAVLRYDIYYFSEIYNVFVRYTTLSEIHSRLYIHAHISSFLMPFSNAVDSIYIYMLASLTRHLALLLSIPPVLQIAF